MLQDYLVPQLTQHHIPMHTVWFQQDGARPHTAASTLAFLRNAFPGKVLSKGGTVEWPPRSPDLSPLDFFLWGHIKTTVYSRPVHSLSQLRSRIISATGPPTSTLRAVMDNLALRCRYCLKQRGKHMEAVLHRQ